MVEGGNRAREKALLQKRKTQKNKTSSAWKLPKPSWRCPFCAMEGPAAQSLCREKFPPCCFLFLLRSPFLAPDFPLRDYCVLTKSCTALAPELASLNCAVDTGTKLTRFWQICWGQPRKESLLSLPILLGSSGSDFAALSHKLSEVLTLLVCSSAWSGWADFSHVWKSSGHEYIAF